MKEQSLVGGFKGFVREEVNKGQAQKYKAILEWLEKQKDINDVQLMSFIARLFFSVGTMFDDEYYVSKAKEYIEKIKENRIAPHFGGSKLVHRAYFAIKAIKDVEGGSFDNNEYSDMVDWLENTSNKKDGGWSRERKCYQEAEAKSDVETTSSAIQILSILCSNNNEEKVSPLIKRGISFLANAKGEKKAWRERSDRPLDVHSTSHAVRAFIAADHFVRGEHSVKNILIDAVDWLQKTQFKGGWGVNEDDKDPNIRETALALIALNRIYEYDRLLVSPYSLMFIDMIQFVWEKFAENHWETPDRYPTDANDSQYSAIIASEIVCFEWYFRSVPYYEVFKKLFGIQGFPRDSKKWIIFLRGFGLFSMLLFFAQLIQKILFRYWQSLEEAFGPYGILSNIVAASFFTLFLYSFTKIMNANPKKILEEYLGVQANHNMDD